MKLIISTTLIIIIAVLILPGLLILGLRDVPGKIQPSMDGVFRVYNNQSLNQKIKVQKDGLSIIGVSIKNANLQNKNDLVLEVSESSQVIRKSTVTGYIIGDGDFVKFKFPPITDSMGKEMMLSFQSPDSKEAEAFEIFYTRENYSNNTTEKIIEGKNEDLGQRLSYVDFYRPDSFIQNAGLIYINIFQRFIQDYIFAGLYSVVMLIGIYYLAKQLRETN